MKSLCENRDSLSSRRSLCQSFAFLIRVNWGRASQISIPSWTARLEKWFLLSRGSELITNWWKTTLVPFTAAISQQSVMFGIETSPRGRCHKVRRALIPREQPGSDFLAIASSLDIAHNHRITSPDIAVQSRPHWSEAFQRNTFHKTNKNLTWPRRLSVFDCFTEKVCYTTIF